MTTDYQGWRIIICKDIEDDSLERSIFSKGERHYTIRAKKGGALELTKKFIDNDNS